MPTLQTNKTAETEGNILPNNCPKEHCGNSDQNGTRRTDHEKDQPVNDSVSVNGDEKENGENSDKRTTEGGQTNKKANITNTNRCGICRKRLGIIPFLCYCGNAFCKQHRMPEDHNCSFDFKKIGRETIRKNNPKILPRKIEKL
uniref:AN1-type domain-containing protein n=1 Tax=Trichuris muris TaxID=70415 RepID=A0A5S6QRL7_TRIMR